MMEKKTYLQYEDDKPYYSSNKFKFDVESFKRDIPQSAFVIIDLLEQAGYESYFVGDCVRALVMDRHVNSYSFTTSAIPEQIEQVFNNYKTTNTEAKKGAIHVTIDEHLYRITTFKTFDKKEPNKTKFGNSLEEDLACRDFTIDALAYNPSVGVIDFCNGILDVQNKTIKCIGDPCTFFKNDSLKILKALRLEATLFYFEIEEDTDLAMRMHYKLLNSTNVSTEDIQNEFNKILEGRFFSDSIIRQYPKIFSFIFHGLAVGNDEKYMLNFISENTTFFEEKNDIKLFSILYNNFIENECYNSEKFNHAVNILKELKYSNKTISNFMKICDCYNSIKNVNVELNCEDVRDLIKDYGKEIVYKTLLTLDSINKRSPNASRSLGAFIKIIVMDK